MGRCGSCRSQTQRFCFVHQEFVCDGCLVNDEATIHGRCVVNTYRKWVLDNSYEWPPTCAKCSIELEADGDNIRRSCMHIEHVSCLEASAAPDHPCGACNMPLENSLNSSEIGKAIMNRVKTIPSMQVFVTKAEAIVPESEEQDDHQSAGGLEGGTEDIPVVVEKAVQEKEVPPTQYKRQNASLQIIETDLAQSVSQVSIEINEPLADFVRTPSQELPKEKCDTILNVGVPSLHSVSNSSGSRQGLTTKREKVGPRHVATASVRKALKAGTRRWFDLRKALFANQKQVLVIVMFVVCVVIVSVLMSGDDREEASLATLTKPVEEGVTLPFVRVNPVIQARANSQRTLSHDGIANVNEN